MLNVLNDPQFIHKVTGLDEEIKKMELNTEDFIEILDDSDEETKPEVPSEERKEEKAEKK